MRNANQQHVGQRHAAKGIATLLLVLGYSVGWVVAAAAVPQEFSAPFRSYEVPLGPGMLRVADMTHDGRGDVVVRTNSTISILPAQADGTLGPRVDLSFGSPTPSVFALADFNGDGWNDIVAGTTLRLSDGAGGFAAGSTVGGSGAPLLAADVVEEGHADLATVVGTNLLSVWPGLGDGTFGARLDTPLPYTALSNSGSRVFGDFNGDGHVDLVYVGFAASQSHLVTLLGNGGGVFVLAADEVVSLGSSPLPSLLAARLDDDTALDLAVSNGQIILGHGDGSFSAPVPGAVDNATVAGDFNADGHTDLAGSRYIYPGNGDGTFGAAISLAYPQTGGGVAVTDLDGDGHDDVLVTGASRALMVNYGNGDFSFGALRAVAPGVASYDHALGDMNGDGRPDLVTAGYTNAANQTALAVQLGDGAGGFVPHHQILGIYSLVAVVLADLNGDGHLDVAAADNYGFGHPALQGWLGNGDGTLQPGVGYASLFPVKDLAVGYFDSDGYPDIVLCGDDASNPIVNLVTHLGTAAGTFATYRVAYSQTASWQSLAVGDVNGDGRQDVLALDTYSSQLRARLFVGTGSSITPLSGTVSIGLVGQPVRVALADLNEDGRLDPLVLNAATGIPLFPAAVEWYENLGGSPFTTFATPFYSGVVSSSTDIRALDLDLDGHVDVAVSGMPAVSVLKGDGAGNLGNRVDYGANGVPTSLAAADLTGDGLPDLTAATLSVNVFLQQAAISAVPESGPRFGLDTRVRPNPTRGALAVEFRLPVASFVSAVVYDVLGRPVCPLFHGELPAGERRLQWSGRDAAGRAVPDGVYFVRVAAGTTIEARKVVVRR